MKKSIYIAMSVILIICSIHKYNDEEVDYKIVSYNGDNLMISIDGIISSSLPTGGNYYLVDYDCNSLDTKITWDRIDYKLNISNKNKKSGVSCNLVFKSNPLLSEMPVGSYVKYVGNNGCEGIHCAGYNANYVDEKNLGYCGDSYFQFHVNGWRIAYIEDGSAHLVSAGATDCMCTSSDGTTSNIDCDGSLKDINKHYDNMRNIALKYCNSNFIKNGKCDSSAIDNEFVKVMDASVFSKITRSTFSINSCYYEFSNRDCGYTNDLIDNGGHYWFGTRSDSVYTFYWAADFRCVDALSSNYVVGVRPVLRLQSSIIVVGGSGTYESPYEIDNNYFVIGDGSGNLNSSSDLSNINLTINSVEDVSGMCISVDTSSCSNYIDYSDTYSLDLSNAGTGEKIIYVYYKDAYNKIVAAMQRTVVINNES